VKLLRTAGLILITVMATLFAVQNLAATEVVFLVWSVSAPRALVYLIVFLAGWVTALLFNALRPRPRTKHAPPPNPPAGATAPE